MGPISGLRVKLQSARVLVPERREAKTGYPLRHAAVHLRSHRHSRHPCGVHHAGRRGVSSMPSFCSHGPPAVVTAVAKLQALVYDILPSTTAVFSYAIGPRKLSANEQFFVGAQTVVSLLQTTQIISDVCFMLPCPLRKLK